MILADTSVWVQHLRSGLDALAAQLDAGAILMHPWVIGEIALGNLSDRSAILALLGRLPRAAVADPDEILVLIEHTSLYGRGVGYVDTQLLAATRLTPGARLWTLDRRLARAAEHLGVQYAPTP